MSGRAIELTTAARAASGSSCQRARSASAAVHPDGNLSARAAARADPSGWPPRTGLVPPPSAGAALRPRARSGRATRNAVPGSTPPPPRPSAPAGRALGSPDQRDRCPASGKAVTRCIRRRLETCGRRLRPSGTSCTAHPPARSRPGRPRAHRQGRPPASRACRRVARPFSTSPRITCDIPSGTSARVSTSLAPEPRALPRAPLRRWLRLRPDDRYRSRNARGPKGPSERAADGGSAGTSRTASWYARRAVAASMDSEVYRPSRS